MIQKKIALIFTERGGRQVAGSLRSLSSDFKRTHKSVAALNKESVNIAAFKGLKRELGSLGQAQKLAAQQTRVLGQANASAALKVKSAKAAYENVRQEVAAAKSAYQGAAQAAKKAGAGNAEAARKVREAKAAWEQKKQKLTEARQALTQASNEVKKTASQVKAAQAQNRRRQKGLAAKSGAATLRATITGLLKLRA